MKKNWKSVSVISLIGILFASSLYWMNTTVKQKVQVQVESSLEDVAIQNVVSVQNEIHDNFHILESISKKFEAIETMNQEQVNEYMGYMVEWGEYQFQYFGVADKKGNAYFSTGRTENIKEKVYFQKSMQKEEYITNVVDNSNIYSVPIINENEVVGVVFAACHTNMLKDLLTIDSFHKEGYMYIIDQEGNVVIHSDKTKINTDDSFIETLIQKDKSNTKNANKMKQELVKEQEGAIQYIFEGVEKYAHYMPLQVRDWWLVTVVPDSVFHERVSQMEQITRAACIVSVTVVLACILVFYEKMSKHQKYLRELAYIDPLTKGYNKTYLRDKWNDKTEKQTKKKTALLVFNLRKFRIFNEIYGVSIGDALLRNVYFMIKRHIRRNGIVVHSQADEFIILYHYNSREELIKWIEYFLKELYQVSYEELQLKMEGTIGVFKIEHTNISFDKMYDYANLARKNAKTKNESYSFFSNDLLYRELRYKELEDSIDHAIEAREFCAWFQPKYNTKDKTVIGGEALVRWKKKDGSFASPGAFIPMCEETGKILKLDRLVFEDVCMQLKKWSMSGKKIVPISVNISRAYLENSGVIEYLKETIEKYQIPAKYLQLEITESSLIENEESLEEIIQKMHHIGFQVLLDDYGVGYSSLKSINSMNFDILKIDKSFIDKIGTVKGNSIVQHTVALASSLGMTSIAEGVEEQKQYEFLLQCQCDEIQGYYFSKPLPAEEFEKLL